MSGPVLHHLPVDASVHHFNSLDYGFGTGESSFVGSDATCGAVAHCAFSQYLNLEPMRTSVSFADTPGALAAAAPSESGVAQARDASSGDRPMEQQQKKMGVECVTTSGRTGVAEELSTSQTFAEAFPPPNFGDMDIQQQADALMSKGPLRTLSARTFEALLDESNVCENEEWTALQNLPSLPRDMSDVAFGEPERDLMGPLAPSAPTPARPSRAYERDDNIYPGRARDFEFVDTSTMGKTPSAIRGRERDEQNARTEYQTSRTEYLDMDTAAVDDARAAANRARARAEEARRVATKATATATTLTIRAKEMLDVASGGSTVGGVGFGGQKAKKGKAKKRESRESEDGVQTPTRSERGGVDGAKAYTDVSSPSSVGRKRARGSTSRPGLRSSGDSTDLEDSESPEDGGDAGKSSRKRKRHGPAPSANAAQTPYTPKATDSILTADGLKIRRGCLNCGCQKTPQWRMGPTGPKTLCNACGVRFRKGMPMLDTMG